MADTIRIAVASDDGTTVRRQHFGSAPLYVIFELREGHPVRIEVRGAVSGKPEHGHGEAAAVLQHLQDCSIFVGGSMGRRSRAILEERGIATHVTRLELVEEAVREALTRTATGP